MSCNLRFTGVPIDDATGKDTVYCNAYVDNIHRYMCHKEHDVHINQLVTPQSIKNVLRVSAKQSDAGSKSLIQFSANLATTGYETLGMANITWQHDAEPPPNKSTVFYVAACALFDLPLSKHHHMSPQQYHVTKQ
eukprot:9441080-Ditylum_brightwellii.AAC.1